MSRLVIDADGHIDEDIAKVLGALPPAVREMAPRSVRTDDGAGSLRAGRSEYAMLIEGKPWTPTYAQPRGSTTHNSAGGEVRLGGRDPVERLKVLDDEGIQAAVLFPSFGLMFGLYDDPEIAAALCAANNDWLASYCAADPRRLIGVALLPQQDPALAAAELERCVERHGFVGGVMRPNKIGGLTVDDPGFDRVWSKASELDVPVVMHEAYLGGGIDTVGEDRMSTYAGGHVVSHAFEQMTAMLVTTLSGVLARHPQLRLGFFESGCGWAPYWTERIEEHYELAPGDFAGGDPAGLLNTRTWITFEVEERTLEATCAAGWADNICFASDYPHYDAVYPGAVKTVLDRSLDRDLEAKLLGENALRFYGSRLRSLIA